MNEKNNKDKDDSKENKKKTEEKPYVGVGIQKCKNCGMKFKYKQLLFILFKTDSLRCRNCGAVHEMNLISRLIPSVLILLPVFMGNRIKDLLPTMPLVYMTSLLYLTIIVTVSPYIFKYKLKNSSEYK